MIRLILSIFWHPFLPHLENCPPRLPSQTMLFENG
ncbi:hypothetical protein SAMD00023520_00975 [Listeria monocytogenes]|nr:hypothetical protein SAMD00023518_00065 [Listeria monocytogenes]GAT38175.1 hypothetical protein SAMD00023519_00337 [Listeria monocytogenes]GAT41023.1 hypothetical protein SAMD00023520_00975 [Listeria monocytogenes]